MAKFYINYIKLQSYIYHMSEKYDICIVGSGIIGISTAYFLSKSALKICVIDQCEDVALVSSEVNGGQLNPHRVDHLNAYTGKNNTPLWDIIKTALSFPSWSLHHMIYRKKVLADKALSHQMSRDIQSAAVQTFLQMKKLKWNGLTIGKRCILDDMVNPLEKNTTCKIDEYPIATGSSHQLAHFLKKKCQGVDFFFNHRFLSFHTKQDMVTELVTDKKKIKADIYILTMGLGLSRWFPLLPVYGLIREYPFSRRTLFNTPNILIASIPAQHAYMNVVGNKLRLGGGNIISSQKPAVNAFHLPTWENHTPTREWVGHRPVSPDGIPIIGKVPPYKNVYVNGGHGFWGWTLSLGTAKILTDHILYNCIIPQSFSSARFSNKKV